MSKLDANTLRVHMPAGRFGRRGADPIKITQVVRSRARISAFKGADLTSTIKAVLGLDLPVPGRVAAAGDVRAIWLQPGVWLLDAPEAAGPEFRAKLKAATDGRAAVLDETDARTTLQLSGAASRQALAKGCRIDLHPRAFGMGHVALTQLAQVPVILVQSDEGPAFEITVGSTFALHLLEWLETACAGIGYEFGPG